MKRFWLNMNPTVRGFLITLAVTEVIAALARRVARARAVRLATVALGTVDRPADGGERAERESWERFSATVGAFHGGPGRISDEHDDELARAYEGLP